MRRTPLALLALIVSLIVIVGLAPGAGAAPKLKDGVGPTVYVGEISTKQLRQLVASGIDRQDLTVRRAGKGAAPGNVAVEVIVGSSRAGQVRQLGLTEKQVRGRTVSKRMESQSTNGYSVFRSYSEPGGLRDEYAQIAADHPTLAKRVVIGKTVRGQEIIALKVTRNASRERDGSRPSVLYVGAQHAREWITPEMNRRLLHHVIDSDGVDAAITGILDRTELWFVPVANPDGYDFTFTAGNRLWRKNLRDNDGDGEITGNDGVDPNRNYPAKWGYDDEGSSSATTSETYRGTKPASEPETRALDGLMKRLRPKFLVNYHSAAELLLYGIGWQVNTPSPDDEVAKAMAGDDAHPAVPGYDPDIAAELYTTNGETDDQASSAYGTVAFTPEMSTCETASAVDPDDAFNPDDCESVFNFPDSEALIQAEYAKNLPFALSVATSALDPDDPVSVVGRQAPEFVVDAFDTSYGSSQTVAVTARRALFDKRLRYAVNGGRQQTATVKLWRGGERYGNTGHRYYGEYRGQITGTKKGDTVEVWFTGRRAGPAGAPVTTRASEHFRYTVASTKKAKVLVIADEDYEGVNPTYPASVTAPKYAQQYVDDLASKGISAVVWDISKQGAPHPLGILAHFKAAIWYLGDNRLTQDPADEETDVFGTPVPDAAVADREAALTYNLRDYLNEGGRLLHTGETAAYFGFLGVGGLYYGLDGAPDQDCVVTEDPFADCLVLTDDFAQYYLGGYSRAAVTAPSGLTGGGRPLTGRNYDLGGPAVVDNPLDEAGVFTPTSTVLPRSRYPQFASSASAFYTGGPGGAYDPVEGSWYAGSPHLDDLYSRLQRTVDLGSVAAGAAPTLQFALSYDTEPGYDNVIVEAHTVGQDDWTTLPELGGGTDQVVPEECEAGFLLEEHPFLEHYLTPGEDACTNTGTTGTWNRFTGNSAGWQQVSFDLSRYAGQRVEVAVSYVTDGSSGGAGVFVDDTRVRIDGVENAREGFERGLGPWSIGSAPEGSPSGRVGFRRAQHVLASGITTSDTVLLGVGAEQLASAKQRADMLSRVMGYLLR